MTSARTFRYELRVLGHLDERHSPWLHGFNFRYDMIQDEPITVLSGVLPDLSALYGLLNKLSSLNLHLIELHELSP